MAELAEANFDTFLENDNGFEAYIEGDQYDHALVDNIRDKYLAQTPLTFSFSTIEKRNWNEEWEKSYHPISVEGKCLIRAAFHQPAKHYPYEIIITPKMSFGTGHHQTTYLMVKNMLDIDFTNKRVMDAGCGTAILSIMASKLGASEVHAFDVDEWSVINGSENAEINHCDNIHIRQGKITSLDFTGKFDIILANINKNVLLEEMGIYTTYLHEGGSLLLSGFFALDLPDLLMKASEHRLKEINQDERETWAALLLQREQAR
jgi:ribosomal protein L11 methyltransferase